MVRNLLLRFFCGVFIYSIVLLNRRLTIMVSLGGYP